MDIAELLEAAQASEHSGNDRIAELRAKLAEAEGPVDLAALYEAAFEQFEQTRNGDQFDPDDLGTLSALADIADAARAEQAAHDEAAAERQQQVDALAARMAGDDSGDDGGDDQGETGEAAHDESNDDSGQPPADDSGDADGEGDTGNPSEQEGAQPVAASNNRRSRPAMNARALNAHRPAQASPAPKVLRRATIQAAADVPQVPSGSDLDMSTLASAAIRKFQSMPVGSPNAVVRNGLAVIKRDYDESLTATGGNDDISKIDRAADETKLPGGSLLAAQEKNLTAAASQGTFSYGGAWCAPSETDYNLCPSLATNAGIADFPSITINHGGLRYPTWNQYPDWSFDFQDFDENADFTTTPKNVITGACPEWVEQRLRVAPLIVQGDILRERGFPELTQRFIDDVMVKHAHFMNGLRLNWIDNNSTALAPFDASTAMGSASYTVADRIGLLVEWMRETYRMAEGATLEGVAPMWLKGLLKADIAKRQNRNTTSVGDGEINAVFTERGARVQWVYDWQGMNPGGASATTPVAAWPTSANILLYPAGAWVAGDQDVISLDAVYDSQNLRNNVYTALMQETAWLMLNRCNPSYKVQLTNLCDNGVVGGTRDVCAPVDTTTTTTTTA